jgi:nicotinamidase-related amidase
MAARVWDRFLTAQDAAHVARLPAVKQGAGIKPAVLLVDLYRDVFGDKPEALLDAIETRPMSCGMAGWDALPHIQRLLAEARALGIPVIHVTKLEDVPSWRRGGPAGSPDRFEIIPEVAPVEGEVVLRKRAPSAFWGTPLVGLLNGLRVDTVIVAGESTSGCVRATVVDAKSYRYKVVIPEECVFDRHESAHAMNLFDMHQKYADVLALDQVIGYLESVAADPVRA